MRGNRSCRHPNEDFPGTVCATMAIRLNISTLFYLALTASAVFMLRAEAGAFAGVGAKGVIDELPARPFSLRAYHAVLMRCDRAMAVPLSRLQPENRQLTTARACGGFAEAAIAAVPTHGFAHLIAARAAGVANDGAAQSKHLARSIEFAPFEGWLAERRFVLAANTAGFGQQVLTPDAAVLLTTQSGAEMLSRYFFRRPGLRELITSALSQATQSDQQRFLNLLTNIENFG